ncbi:zinc finger, CCHC-type containing protein [Tanacetum coccineum]
MLQELKSMFEKQAGVERFDLIQTFHACKQEEGKSVSLYAFKMKGYGEQMERLSYVLPQDISVGLILNGLTSDFVCFVRNYNMHNMGKTTGGRIQKPNKKPQAAKGKGKEKCKGKNKLVYVPKPKNPEPAAKEHPTKDDVCHHCKEVGHWMRNCLVYLAELMKKKKQDGNASTLGIFTIKLFSFLNKSWVYDTGCGTHICNTKHGLRCERKLKQETVYLYVDNGVRAQVEAIGSFDLLLPNGSEDVNQRKQWVTISTSHLKTKLLLQDTSPSKNTNEIPVEAEVEEHSLGDLNEPANYKSTLLDPESNKWLDAMNAEMQSMKDNQVWHLVDLPPNEMFSPVADIRAISDLIGSQRSHTFYAMRVWIDTSKRGYIPIQERLDLNKTQGALTSEEVKVELQVDAYWMLDLRLIEMILNLRQDKVSILNEDSRLEKLQAKYYCNVCYIS